MSIISLDGYNSVSQSSFSEDSLISSDGDRLFEHKLFSSDNDFSQLDGMSSDDIKDYLDQDNFPRLTFEVDGQEYFLRKNASWAFNGKDVYQAFTRNGSIVDADVVMGGENTVEGFIEIGGIKGVSNGTNVRLYLGADDSGNFAAIVHTANLDSDDVKMNGKSHRDTLLETGEYIYLEEEASDSLQTFNLATAPALKEPEVRQKISLPQLKFNSNGGDTEFKEMSGTEIKEFLNQSNYPMLSFIFEGEQYYFRKNVSWDIMGKDNYQVFTRNGNLVDMEVDFDNNMEGDFAAISDLPGLGEDENVYAGEDRRGNFVVTVDLEGATEFSKEAVTLYDAAEIRRARNEATPSRNRVTLEESSPSTRSRTETSRSTRDSAFSRASVERVTFRAAAVDDIDTTIAIIGEMANDMAAVVNQANADFKSAVENIDAGAFSDLILAQAGAANLTATVSASTGALSAVTSAVSTSAGKIGQ